MEDKLLSRTIPGTITETGIGDIWEKSVGINDGLGRFRSVLLKFTVNTLGIKGTLPFNHLENTDKDSIHIVLLFSNKHLVIVSGQNIVGIKHGQRQHTYSVAVL